MLGGPRRWSTCIGPSALTDKITVLEVEAVQLVACLLCIHDVVIDNKGSALGIGGNALADLAIMGVSSEIDPRGAGVFSRSKGGVPNRPVLAEELKELLRSDVVAVEACVNIVSSKARVGACIVWASTTYLRFLTNKALDITICISRAPRLAKGVIWR